MTRCLHYGVFEWDETKRLKNLHTRYLDFGDAWQVFAGRPALDGSLYTVVWTWRGESRRVISFRRASMAKKEPMVRHTAEELRAKSQRGETRSDWAKAAAMTDAEVEASIASDPDEAGMVIDWDSATVEMPQPKAVLNMRVDRDVLDYFRKMGRGCQTRINAVLRSYVERRRYE